MKEKSRNSNHELLRMISMFLIIMVHINMYADEFYAENIIAFFKGITNGICNIGVTCFVLISGYYGINFSIKKLVKMECMMITYSLIETLVLLVVFPDKMQGMVLLEQLVKSCFPYITRKYWFYSSYVTVFLLSGWIQKWIDCLEREEFKRVIVLLLTLLSILPTVCYFEIVPDNGKGLMQMIMIYLIGRYIRKYKDVYISRRKSIPVFLGLWIINAVSHECPISLGDIYHNFCKDNSITNITMAVILFYLFKDMFFSSKIINKSAKYIFAAFALNNSLVGVMMKILRNNGLVASENISGFLLLSGIVFLILVICLLIGMVREQLLTKMDDKVAKIVEVIVKKIANQYDLINKGNR